MPASWIYSQCCNHHFHFILKHFYQPERKISCPLNSKSPYFPPSIPGNYSMGVSILNIVYNWNHTILGLCIWFLSLRIMSSSFTHIVTHSTLFGFCGWEIFHCILYHILFIYSSVVGHLDLPPHFGYCE